MEEAEAVVSFLFDNEREAAAEVARGLLASLALFLGSTLQL